MTTTTDTSDPKHPVKIERFSRSLKVLLTDQQVLERARRAAALANQIANKESERDAAKKHANAQIEELEAEQQRLNGEVNDGATYQDIVCERRYNYRIGIVHEVRTDTQEVIPGSERPMSDRERQVDLDLQPANADYGGEEDDEEPLPTQKKRNGKGKGGKANG